MERRACLYAKYAVVVAIGQRKPIINEGSLASLRVENPKNTIASIIPKHSPAPLDCSDRSVNETKVPAKNAKILRELSIQQTAQYTAKQAQKVLSQLWRTMKRYGAAVIATRMATNNEIGREHVRRASAYVTTGKIAPNTTSSVRATGSESPNNLNMNAVR